jgi:hypothetical protein
MMREEEEEIAAAAADKQLSAIASVDFHFVDESFE